MFKEAVILGVEDDSMQPLFKLKLASGDPSGERDYSRPSSPSRPADDAAAGSMRPGYLSDDCNEESFHELGQKEPQVRHNGAHLTAILTPVQFSTSKARSFCDEGREAR